MTEFRNYLKKIYIWKMLYFSKQLIILINSKIKFFLICRCNDNLTSKIYSAQ